MYTQQIKDFFKFIFSSAFDITRRFIENTINKAAETNQAATAKIHDIRNLPRVYDISQGGKITINHPSQLFAGNSSITGTDLVTILKAEPAIKELHASYCRRLSDIPDDFPIMSQLTKINLSGSKVTGTGLVTLLKKTANVKQLSASGCFNLNNFINSNDPLNLSQLEEIWLEGSSTTWGLLATILAETSNLKLLSIREGQNINNTIPRNINSLPQLNRLYTFGMAGSVLAVIIAKAPKIEDIHANSSTGLTNSFANNLPMMLELKNLCLYASDITGVALASFLAKAPNVIEVDIEGCINFTVVDKIKINRFRANNPNIQLSADFRQNDFTVDVLSNNLIAHFEALLLQSIACITEGRSKYNAYARYISLPNELIMMMGDFLASGIDGIKCEIQALKDLFPELQDVIVEFENSTAFKAILTSYNDHLQGTISTEITNAKKMTWLLSNYVACNKYTSNFNYLRNDLTLLDPKDNPFQLTLRV